MSRKIYVQAQSDHMELLSKASPFSAIEELVWNALDADAKEVKIDTFKNGINGIEAIRIADDGSGIDVLQADSTFGSLGGSWKKDETGTRMLKRKLHGHRGSGRFKAFSLGTHVEWRTTMRAGNDLLSYKISGDLSDIGLFEIEAYSSPGPATGTEVYIQNSGPNCTVLSDTAETIQILASKFALYLMNYPDVKIYFDGLPVTPAIVQQRVVEKAFATNDGETVKLRIIEWRKKFSGAGKLVLAGRDGFRCAEYATGTRAGGIPYTAYLISEKVTRLANENALELGELHPEVRELIDGAKKTLKQYFRDLADDKAAAFIGNWSHEGSYPYPDEDISKERSAFDKNALELASRFNDFNDLSADERRIIFKLLKCAMESGDGTNMGELLK